MIEPASGVLAFGVSHWEMLVIGGVVVLLFFGHRVPEVMRSLGKGLTQFKKGMHEGTDDEKDKRPPSDHPDAKP